MNLEQYRQNGGTYVLPCEVMNELQQENKELKQKDYDHFAYLKRIDNLEKENKELSKYKNIIEDLKLYLDLSKQEEFEKSYGKRNGKTFAQAEIIIFNMVKNKIEQLEKGVDE